MVTGNDFKKFEKPAVIATSRLTLRELENTDLNNLAEILTDPETMQYYPRPFTRKEVAGWIEKSGRSYQENGFGLWAVELSDTGVFIGQCGISIQDIDGDFVPEIGYHIHKNHQRRGYAVEAASECLKYGFQTFKLREIYIHTWIKNIPSIRVAEKIGMIRRKEYDKHIPMTGGVMRHVVFSAP